MSFVNPANTTFRCVIDQVNTDKNTIDVRPDSGGIIYDLPVNQGASTPGMSGAHSGFHSFIYKIGDRVLVSRGPDRIPTLIGPAPVNDPSTGGPLVKHVPDWVPHPGMGGTAGISDMGAIILPGREWTEEIPGGSNTWEDHAGHIILGALPSGSRGAKTRELKPPSYITSVLGAGLKNVFVDSELKKTLGFAGALPVLEDTLPSALPYYSSPEAVAPSSRLLRSLITGNGTEPTDGSSTANFHRTISVTDVRPAVLWDGDVMAADATPTPPAEGQPAPTYQNGEIWIYSPDLAALLPVAPDKLPGNIPQPSGSTTVTTVVNPQLIGEVIHCKTLARLPVKILEMDVEGERLKCVINASLGTGPTDDPYIPPVVDPLLFQDGTYDLLIYPDRRKKIAITATSTSSGSSPSTIEGESDIYQSEFPALSVARAVTIRRKVAGLVQDNYFDMIGSGAYFEVPDALASEVSTDSLQIKIILRPDPDLLTTTPALLNDPVEITADGVTSLWAQASSSTVPYVSFGVGHTIPLVASAISTDPYACGFLRLVTADGTSMGAGASTIKAARQYLAPDGYVSSSSTIVLKAPYSTDTSGGAPTLGATIAAPNGFYIVVDYKGTRSGASQEILGAITVIAHGTTGVALSISGTGIRKGDRFAIYVGYLRNVSVISTAPDSTAPVELISVAPSSITVGKDPVTFTVTGMGMHRGCYLRLKKGELSLNLPTELEGTAPIKRFSGNWIPSTVPPGYASVDRLSDRTMLVTLSLNEVDDSLLGAYSLVVMSQLRSENGSDTWEQFPATGTMLSLEVKKASSIVSSPAGYTMVRGVTPSQQGERDFGTRSTGPADPATEYSAGTSVVRLQADKVTIANTAASGTRGVAEKSVLSEILGFFDINSYKQINLSCAGLFMNGSPLSGGGTSGGATPSSPISVHTGNVGVGTFEGNLYLAAMTTTARGKNFGNILVHADSTISVGHVAENVYIGRRANNIQIGAPFVDKGQSLRVGPLRFIGTESVSTRACQDATTDPTGMTYKMYVELDTVVDKATGGTQRVYLKGELNLAFLLQDADFGTGTADDPFLGYWVIPLV